MLCHAAAGVDQSCAHPVISDDPARLGIPLQPVLCRRPRALFFCGDHPTQALADQLLDQGVVHQPRGPHDHARTDLLVPILLDRQAQPPRAVRVGPDPLDAVARLDADVLPAEQARGVVGERLVEHGQDLGRDVVHRDADQGHEGRV